MNFSDEFCKADFTTGPFPEAHTIAGKKVPPDGATQPGHGEDGFMRNGRQEMPIGLSYGQGDFSPYRQHCGEGLYPSFGLNFSNSIPFSCGNVHPHTALLLFALVLNQRPKIIIETGTFYGYSTWFMAQALMAWGDEESMLYTIDRTDSLIASQVKNHPKVTCITGESQEELPKLLEEVGEVQLAFLDSWKRLARHEFLTLHSYVPPGGIVVFHDSQMTNTGKALYQWLTEQPEHRDLFETMLFAGTPHLNNPHRFFGNADDRGLLLLRRKEANPFLNVADAGSTREGLGDRLL